MLKLHGVNSGRKSDKGFSYSPSVAMYSSIEYSTTHITIVCRYTRLHLVEKQKARKKILVFWGLIEQAIFNPFLRPRGFPSSAFLSIKWHAALFCQNGLGNFIFKQVLKCIIENDSENTNWSHYRTAPKKKDLLSKPFYRSAQGVTFMESALDFLKFLVFVLDFWTWFFVYFKLDFYCPCRLKFKNQFQKSSAEGQGENIWFGLGFGPVGNTENNIVRSALKSWETKSEIYIFNRLIIYNQFCLASLEIPPCATSIKWLCLHYLPSF